MTRGYLHVLAGLALLGGAQPLQAQQAPSYARDVRPFLAKYCLECHNARSAKAGLDLETYKALRAGSDGGPVVVPGKADASPLVLLVEGKEKPRMPPKEAKRHPKPAEVARLRAWVTVGAKDDSAAVASILPDIRPRTPVATPITALAYRDDGKALLAGGHGEFSVITPANGQYLRKQPKLDGTVTALAFRPHANQVAVALGTPGTGARVDLYRVMVDNVQAIGLNDTLVRHADVIHDVAFSPDGKTVATCSYDRTVKLADVDSLKEIRTLREHSDAVYSVSFNRDGTLLASGAADRAVKVWEVKTGKLLYTLGEATDWVYAVRWSPDGRHLAAAGADKSIRVWEASASGGKLVHSVFAHEAPVVRLAYSPDGKTLYSAGEDRSVKAWDTARMVERTVYPRQPESVLALAVRPDGKQLALGRYDGAALLLDEPSGKVQAQPLPFKPQPPSAKKLSPNSAVRGKAVRVTVTGAHLESVNAVSVSPAGAVVQIVQPSPAGTELQIELRFPATTPPGVYQVTLAGPAGQTTPLPITVNLAAPTAEKEPNNSPGTGQQIALPATVVGALDRTGDVDYYRFEAKAGQQLGVQVLTAASGSKLEPYLRLTDTAGEILAESSDGILGYTCVKAGTYALGIRDRDYRGGAGMHYRLHVGDLAVLTAVFPLGLRRGSDADIRVEGVHLGSLRSVKVKASADAAPGSTLPVTITTAFGTPLRAKTVVVGEFPEVTAAPGVRGTIATPGTANGRIAAPGATDVWRFTAKKGQRLILEVAARRLGSPLDSYIEILDAVGRPLPRATLRSLAKTYVTFRDHDSASQGIRIEAWGELAVNDYILVGGELLRIRELPPNPDADCFFVTERGQRVGFLDTTPTHHAMGTPMYKVAIHPPGTTFPPNGFPVVTLYYRNDDGGPGYGRDSRLFFDPPADGEYQVRIGDSRGQGGSDHAYRLTVRPPRPSYNVSFTPTAPAVWKGGAVPITVTADRIDGYAGEIALRLDKLPPGFSAPATSIPAGENSTAFALYADANAKSPAKAPPLKLTARAVIDGREVVKEVSGQLPKVIEPGDIVTTTDESAVTVRPGERTRLTVRVERRKGFKGRIPLEVRGLPHGVRVLDIGLNGILITEQDTMRTVVIYAEPWVQPREHPFVVLARREGSGTLHAARSVLLKVGTAP